MVVAAWQLVSARGVGQSTLGIVAACHREGVRAKEANAQKAGGRRE